MKRWKEKGQALTEYTLLASVLAVSLAGLFGLKIPQSTQIGVLDKDLPRITTLEAVENAFENAVYLYSVMLAIP